MIYLLVIELQTYGMDIQSIRRARLRAYINANFKSVAEVEQKTSANASMISSLFSKSAPKTFGERMARNLEDKLGLPDRYLDRDDAEPSDRSETIAPRGAGRWVPVVGEARLGDGGFFNETSYEPGTEGYVLSLIARPDSYALKCKGDSMYPAIFPGDYVVVHPTHRLEFGKWVMCQTIDGRRMIKIYSSVFDGITELRSLNGKVDPITLDADEIRHLHFADGRVAPSYHQPTID